PSPAAAAVLDQAAIAASQTPAGPQPGPGQYLYMKSLTAGLTGVGTASPGQGAPKLSLSLNMATMQEWIAPNGSGREVFTPTASMPLSAQGKPTGSGSRSPSSLAKPTTLSFAPGKLPYPDASLPTNPAALRQAIQQRFEGGKADPAATFEFAGSFLQETASPALRSALYRMVAHLPGVTSLGHMTDRLGRSGVGVAIVDHGVRHELIFNPRTSAVLQSQEVSVSPNLPAPPGMQSPAPGSVIGYTVYVSTGIVNSTVAVPPSA
ncbi:MAG: CU044_5270 family protein, partial [Acidimicrobiales bacterium]